MEDNFASWDEKQQFWQMVAKLGGSIQDYQSKVTPFELVYGQEIVLPMEVNLDTY